MIRLGALLALLACAAPGFAAERESPLCGTSVAGDAIEIARHRFFSARSASDRTRALQEGPRFELVGDLVVVTDDGSLVSEANPFDLRGASLVFERGGSSRYRSSLGSEPVEPGLGDVFDIGDDATRVYELPFAFPFFGREYRRLYLNSDGNLTFGEGDHASTERSVGRFLSGPPRVALFFADMDPSAGGEVRVANLPDRFVATWNDVPEWDETAPNTFQVELRQDGSIHMRYGATINAGSAVVGVSPGAATGLGLVDLSEGPNEAEGALAERFLQGREIDTVGLSRAFYRFFPDRFDALVVWTNFASDARGAFAYESSVRNAVEGIGDAVFDRGEAWGSAAELESFVFMGDLSRYPRDPGLVVTRAASRPTTLALLAHEVGHQWLARARLSADGVGPNALLGRQEAHWSFFFDSDASFLEGNEIEPRGDRSFRTVETISRYSRLDLYLMGLAPAAEVAPMFLVANASATSSFGEIDAESAPRVGVDVTGDRKDVTLDDVERALGPRRPDFESSQKTFRHAWILLTRRGVSADEVAISQLERARTAFAAFFNQQTLGRATIVNDVAP